jgi:hypothetical protein
MSQEDVETNDKKTKTFSSLTQKKIKIFIFLVLVIIIGASLYHFINFSTEGNPNINFSEVNETIAASHQISHLTEQDYQAFPKLRETIENPNAYLTWTSGYRYIGVAKISEQQKGYITGKYTSEVGSMGYLEYQGKYYAFAISLS